jgi:hypothetical protein
VKETTWTKVCEALNTLLASLADEFGLDDDAVETLRSHTVEGFSLLLHDSELATKNTDLEEIDGFLAKL